jgi:hypothetical protein
MSKYNARIGEKGCCVPILLQYLLKQIVFQSQYGTAALLAQLEVVVGWIEMFDCPGNQ